MNREDKVLPETVYSGKALNQFVSVAVIKLGSTVTLEGVFIDHSRIGH